MKDLLSEKEIKQTIYLPKVARLAQVETLTRFERFMRVEFEDGSELGHVPGQFVQVSVLGVGEAPLTIASSPTRKGYFDMCVRRVGKVTEALHRLQKGDAIGIRGPFGRGFPTTEVEGKDILFVAGGIGLVPLRAIIQYVLDNRDKYGRVIILYGTRTPEDRLFLDELKEWKERDDVEFLDTVDRSAPGWDGNVGVITTLFPKIELEPKKTVAMVVGPPVMYKFVMLALSDKEVPDENIYVSLERHMKCGVGKCGHCQINDVLVCRDGPTLSYAEIKELMEAIH